MTRALLTLPALLLVGAALAGPKSGPQVGDVVPGPFEPLNLTGTHAGEESCLFCRFGQSPVAVVFTRENTPAVGDLLARLDAANAREPRMGSYAVFLSDSSADDKFQRAVKKVAGTRDLKHTVLAVMPAAGPAEYEVAADAAVTVVLYDAGVVKANHSFAAGKLDAAGIDAIADDLPKILTAKPKKR